MNTLKPLQIDIVSTIVCPWCYIGKRRIETRWRWYPRCPSSSLAPVLSQIRGCRARESAATNTCREVGSWRPTRHGRPRVAAAGEGRPVVPPGSGQASAQYDRLPPADPLAEAAQVPT